MPYINSADSSYGIVKQETKVWRVLNFGCPLEINTIKIVNEKLKVYSEIYKLCILVWNCTYLVGALGYVARRGPTLLPKTTLTIMAELVPRVKFWENSFADVCC